MARVNGIAAVVDMEDIGNKITYELSVSRLVVTNEVGPFIGHEEPVMARTYGSICPYSMLMMIAFATPGLGPLDTIDLYANDEFGNYMQVFTLVKADDDRLYAIVDSYGCHKFLLWSGELLDPLEFDPQ